MSELQAEKIEPSGVVVENSQNSAISAGSRPSHLWQPGQSGNPSGRPKCALISEKLREILRSEDASGETGADKLGKKLVDLTDDAKDGYLRLAAIKEITDRVEGKAVQNTNVRGVFVMMPPDNIVSNAFDALEPEPE